MKKGRDEGFSRRGIRWHSESRTGSRTGTSVARFVFRSRDRERTVLGMTRWRVPARGAGRTGAVGGSCAGTGEPIPARPAVVTLKPRAALACVRPGRWVEGVRRACGHQPKTVSYEQTVWARLSTNATKATGPGTARRMETYLCRRRGRDLFQQAGGACAAKHESHRASVFVRARGRGLDWTDADDGREERTPKPSHDRDASAP